MRRKQHICVRVLLLPQIVFEFDTCPTGFGTMVDTTVQITNKESGSTAAAEVVATAAAAESLIAVAETKTTVVAADIDIPAF